MKPILVIPVYNGGEFFTDCLNSIIGKEHCFEKIFISFNGIDAEIQSDIARYDLANVNKNYFKIFKTEKFLSSVQHDSFILAELEKNGCSGDTFIMNLFHDDMLINVPNLFDLELDEILLGNWKILSSSQVRSAIRLPYENPQEWLRRFGFYRIFTNGSGIIASFKIFKDVNTFMLKYNSGVRYEYLLATHNGIRKITKSDLPLVEVRIHSGQSGANVSLRNFILGEIGFIKWLYFQNRIKSFRDCIVIIFLASSTVSSLIRHLSKRIDFKKIKASN